MDLNESSGVADDVLYLIGDAEDELLNVNGAEVDWDSIPNMEGLKWE